MKMRITHQNLWDTTKGAGRKFVVRYKEEKLRISNLNCDLKNQVKD